MNFDADELSRSRDGNVRQTILIRTVNKFLQALRTWFLFLFVCSFGFFLFSSCCLHLSVLRHPHASHCLAAAAAHQQPIDRRGHLSTRARRLWWRRTTAAGTADRNLCARCQPSLFGYFVPPGPLPAGSRPCPRPLERRGPCVCAMTIDTPPCHCRRGTNA